MKVSGGGGQQSAKVTGGCPGDMQDLALVAQDSELGCATPAAAVPAQGQHGMLSPSQAVLLAPRAGRMLLGARQQPEQTQREERGACRGMEFPLGILTPSPHGDTPGL